jgi:ribosome-associated translation inhibitor RaiA
MGEGPAAEPKHEMQGGSGRAIPRRPALEEQVEQAPPAGEPGPPFDVKIVSDPGLGDDVRQHALDLVARLARTTARPVLHARVTVKQLSDRALERPAVAKATLDVNGRPVRAHVAERTVDLALHRLEERLRRNLADLEERRREGRHEPAVAAVVAPADGERLLVRPEYLDVPVEERELVRRKTCALVPLRPEEAVVEMDAVDHDFHLFLDADTGDESLVYREPDGASALLHVHGSETLERGGPLPARAVPAPTLSLRDAVERLSAGGERFVFFVDARTGRGNVVYRRFDGHYGLIEPAIRNE